LINSAGQIGDGTSGTDRIFPTLINISSIYSKNINFQFTKFLVTGTYHTCAFFLSPFACFKIDNNDSSVCKGNGKNN
jgi:hypothetical protein